MEFFLVVVLIVIVGSLILGMKAWKIRSRCKDGWHTYRDSAAVIYKIEQPENSAFEELVKYSCIIRTRECCGENPEPVGLNKLDSFESFTIPLEMLEKIRSNGWCRA